MKFVNPWMLVLVALVPVAGAWWVFLRARAERRLNGLVAPALQGRLLPRNPRLFNLQATLLLTGLALVLFAAARPQWGHSSQKMQARTRNVVVALDVSRSMLAADVRPNRLERAKADVADLIDSLEGDRCALVAFRRTGVLLCPLTTDHGFLRSTLESATPESAPRGETDLGSAIRTSLDALDPAADDHNAIILISDGGDLRGGARDAARLAAKRNVPVFTVGLGNPRAETSIPDASGTGSQQYQGKAVTTKLEEAALAEIAKLSGGRYVPLATAGTAETTLGAIYRRFLRQVAAKEQAEEEELRATERFGIFLVPGLLLVLLAGLFSRGRFAGHTGRSGFPEVAGRSAVVLAAVLAGNIAIPASGAEEAVLWPSGDTVMRAQQDSSIAPLPDGSMGVTTGVKASWPGVRMDFVKGEADLSRFGRFVVAVSNTTEETRTVHLSVKGRAVQGQGPGGAVTLKPHATGEIVASVRRLPWALDAPLKLEGMNGRLAAQEGAGGGFDIHHATSFHIFYCQDGVASGFSVLRVTADGVGAPEPKVLPAKTFLPFVDRFGQFMHDDWPGKVHDEAELARTKADEDAWLAKNGATPIPEADRFGGWAGGPQLKATGFFRTEKANGKWWLVDPEGRLFFSHGVDCVGIGNGTTGIGFRENYFSWTPAKDDPEFGGFWGKCTWPAAHNFYKDPAHLPYDTFSFANANLRRKYGAGWKAEYIDRAHRRLRAWGLNTIANWSWSEIYSLDRTPYTLCLGTHGTPRLKDSKGWWGALPDPFNPEFEKKFRERARNAAKTMRDDPWCVGVFVDNELSWNNEERMKDVAEKYFSTIRRVLKEELPNHLYLGCRIAWGTDVIYRAAARHCDVVSVNIYNRRPVKDLPPDAEDKPMINGEFHFGALDRGMFHTGLVATRDQDERAQCYRDFVNACLDHPRFVGTHWFQWQDQALTGRSDGENYQIGFLNVADVPYPELVSAARDVAAAMYRRRWAGAPAN